MKKEKEGGREGGGEMEKREKCEMHDTQHTQVNRPWPSTI